MITESWRGPFWLAFITNIDSRGLQRDIELEMAGERIICGAQLPVHSFATLLAELASPPAPWLRRASRARVTYELKSEGSNLTFKQVPEPTPLQARASELIRLFPVAGN